MHKMSCLGFLWNFRCRAHQKACKPCRSDPCVRAISAWCCRYHTKARDRALTMLPDDPSEQLRVGLSSSSFSCVPA